MVQNSPYKSLQHKDLTVEGYSRAAVQSYWRIPELKLGFSKPQSHSPMDADSDWNQVLATLAREAARRWGE